MRWTFQPQPDKSKTEQLASELNVDPLIATLLLQRGITTFEDVLKTIQHTNDKN